MKTLLIVTLLACALPAAPAAAAEVMEDRCKAEVAIPQAYDNGPASPGVIVLKRANGKTPWTPPFTVRLGGSGHIRWWCHSTTGNAFDPGTWRIKELGVATKCRIYADASPESCSPDASVKIGSSAWNGWTPERSRCGNRSTRIRARLDGNRLLQIQCLGH